MPAQWPVLPPAAVTGCVYERPWLEDLGCANEATLGKAPDAGQVQLQVIVRRFEDAVQVHTRAAAAQRSLLQTDPPRTQPKVVVPKGGRVVLTDGDGSCLGIYEATASLSRVAVP